MFVALLLLGSPLFHFILFMDSSSKEHIYGAMSTCVRLVDQMIRYTAPRIILSFYRGEIKKRKRYSDRAVRPCSFLFDVIFPRFLLQKVACLLSACAKDLIRVKLGFEKSLPLLAGVQVYSLIFSKDGLSQKTFFFFSKSLNVLVESRSARRPVVSDLVFDS
mgnify:CR=1 FL=1